MKASLRTLLIGTLLWAALGAAARDASGPSPKGPAEPGKAPGRITGHPDPRPEMPLKYVIRHGQGRHEAASPPGPVRTVLGYLPYWEVHDLSHIRWDLLTHVAYFAVEVDASGNLAATHGWPDGEAVKALLDTARANGVKVVLTAMNFDSGSIGSMIKTPPNRRRTVQNLLDAALEAGADGVSVDFEFVPASRRSAFASFMGDLADAFHQTIPGSHVSVVTPPVDDGGAYDLFRLAGSSDALYAMAYEYHWRTGPVAGPLSPLHEGNIWDTGDATDLIARHVAQVGSSHLDRLLLGVPLYGYLWPTTAESVPSATRGYGIAIPYGEATLLAAEYGRSWDPESQTPFFTTSDGGPHQGWYEDAESLGLKWDLVLDQNLGGTGVWALNYAKSDALVWNEIEDRFTGPLESFEGVRIVVDPGHGGGDPGVVGPTGLAESEVCLATSRLLKEILLDRGAKVYQTRDEGFGPNLTARSDYLNAVGADFVVSIHLNGCGGCGENLTGVRVSENACPNRTRTLGLADAAVIRLGEALGLGLDQGSCVAGPGVTSGAEHLLREAASPSALILPSHIDYPPEEDLLREDERRRLIASAVLAGFEDYLRIAAVR